MWLVEALGYKLKKTKKNWFFTASEVDTSLDLTCFFLPVPSSNNKLYDLVQIQSPPNIKTCSLVHMRATIGRRLTKKGILVRSPAFLILDVEIIGGVRRQDKGCLVFCGAGWRPLLSFFVPTKWGKNWMIICDLQAFEQVAWNTPPKLWVLKLMCLRPFGGLQLERDHNGWAPT